VVIFGFCNYHSQILNKRMGLHTAFDGMSKRQRRDVAEEYCGAMDFYNSSSEDEEDEEEEDEEDEEKDEKDKMTEAEKVWNYAKAIIDSGNDIMECIKDENWHPYCMPANWYTFTKELTPCPITSEHLHGNVADELKLEFCEWYEKIEKSYRHRSNYRRIDNPFSQVASTFEGLTDLDDIQKKLETFVGDYLMYRRFK